MLAAGLPPGLITVLHGGAETAGWLLDEPLVRFYAFTGSTEVGKQLMAQCAGTVKKVHFNDLRKAMIYGSVLASFCVEAFSLERLRSLSMEEIAKRYETFKLMSQFEVPV